MPNALAALTPGLSWGSVGGVPDLGEPSCEGLFLALVVAMAKRMKMGVGLGFEALV